MYNFFEPEYTPNIAMSGGRYFSHPAPLKSLIKLVILCIMPFQRQKQCFATPKVIK